VSWVAVGRVLVIGQDELNLQILTSLLRRGLPQAEVICATTVTEAWAALDQPYDVILVDPVLADMELSDVVPALLERAGSAAVIVLTEAEDDESVLAMLGHGVQDHLLRHGLEERLLVRTIRHAVMRKTVEGELRRLNAELAVRTLEVAESAAREVRAREHLLSSVSHELRTPLAAITQFVTVLAKGVAGPLTPDQETILERVGANARYVASMVDDLLDTVRSDSGHLPVVMQRVDVVRAVDQAMETLRPTADRKGVVMGRDEPPQPLPEVVADPVRLVQVLVNILGNAVKFTGSGAAVTVSLRPPVGGRVTIEIADEGCGIPEDLVDAVFERLTQAHDTDDGRHGLGLGLHLARSLAELQGGRIELRSELGVGTCVSISLAVWELESVLAGVAEGGAGTEAHLVSVHARSPDAVGPAARAMQAELHRLAVPHLGPGVALAPTDHTIATEPVIHLVCAGDRLSFVDDYVALVRSELTGVQVWGDTQLLGPANDRSTANKLRSALERAMDQNGAVNA
jgi:signal transduction histidine kinase